MDTTSSRDGSVAAKPLPPLRDDQDVNYYVIVPYTTFAAAEWAMGHIGVNFDCHVISAAAVDQDAPVLSSVKGESE